MTVSPATPLTRKVINALYTEAMLLADEARAYFDYDCIEERDRLQPYVRVIFACEALKLTSRMSHVIVSLLAARGQDESRAELHSPIDDEVSPAIFTLPSEAQSLILASQSLHKRVARLYEQLSAPPRHSSVEGMLRQISAAF